MLALLIAAAAIVPPELVAPTGSVLALSVQGRGVQIYACEAKDGPNEYGWRLSGPEAVLLDAQGHAVGRHFAGPTWRGEDGGEVVGQVQAKAASPTPSAVDWLLLRAKSTSGPGVFGRTAYIQRLDTKGGQPPSAGCDGTRLGDQVRVPYSAEYDFYTSP